jgi:hypothetical protein
VYNVLTESKQQFHVNLNRQVLITTSATSIDNTQSTRKGAIDAQSIAKRQINEAEYECTNIYYNIPLDKNISDENQE